MPAASLRPAPGSPGASMTIAGNLAFQSGALYVVYLNPTTSTFANVTGTASLAGTVQAVRGRKLSGQAIHDPDRDRRARRHDLLPA